MPKTNTPRKLAFFIYPGFKLLDLTGPLQVFADAERGFSPGGAPYNIAVVSRKGGHIESDTPVKIDSMPVIALRGKRLDTFVVVGGRGVYDAAADAKTVAAVERLSGRSGRVASVCS
ncbi:MAG: DJ-1/PfpI family protein, partial [Pseudomonadota bacterium]